MTNPGLLLHQIGCWVVLEEQEPGTARNVVKAKKKELIHNAGMPYTLVVDLCLASKEDSWEPQVQAERTYRNVIVPLQKIVNELCLN